MTRPAHGAADTRAARVERRAARSFLPELQALRMWAVGLVVVFHLWPTGWFTGGFVGVDAFFVISGYLITSHLLREVERTGHVRLLAFYARRARRLLPASLTVLAVSALMCRLFLPQDAWVGTAHEIRAATFYVENLWLASEAVSYSASTDAASVVQHYWSLSTEEQFYLVWPSLVLLGLTLGRRFAPRRPITAIGAVLLTTGLASFVASVVITHDDPAAAYFLTWTRAWEFAIGGLLPLLLRRYVPPGPFAVVLRYTGTAGLVLSAAVLSQASPFPGWVAAWPALSTALVIVAGDCEGRDRLGIAFTHPVVQWLGNISYSIYLVHWPLIVITPFVVGGPLRLRHKLSILAVTLVLAHLCRRYVEDALGRFPDIVRVPWRTLVAAAVGMLLAAGCAQGLVRASDRADAARESRLAEMLGSTCVGGPAGLQAARCPDAFAAKPTVGIGPTDYRVQPQPGCSTTTEPYRECQWGTPTATVAVVGDSHAQHYDAALTDIAKRKGWRLLEFSLTKCAPADGPAPAFLGTTRKDPAECSRWVRSVTAQLRAEHVDLIVTSAYSRAEPVVGDATAAYQRVWDEWTRIADVVVVRDVPGTGETDMPACLAQHHDDARACARPREDALAGDQMWTAALASTNPRVHRLDLTSAYCDAQTCYAVVGRLPVYYDRNHISRSFVRTLTPAIEAGLPDPR